MSWRYQPKPPDHLPHTAPPPSSTLPSSRRVARAWESAAGRGILAVQFREAEQLASRVEYARELSRGVAHYQRLSQQVDHHREALDQHYLPVRRKLRSLQARVWDAGLVTAEAHSRLGRMRRHVADEAGRLGELQHRVRDLRGQVQSARRQEAAAALEGALGAAAWGALGQATAASSSEARVGALAALSGDAHRSRMFGGLSESAAAQRPLMAAGPLSSVERMRPDRRPGGGSSGGVDSLGAGRQRRDRAVGGSGVAAVEARQQADELLVARLAQLPAPSAAALAPTVITAATATPSQGAAASEVQPNPEPESESVPAAHHPPLRGSARARPATVAGAVATVMPPRLRPILARPAKRPAAATAPAMHMAQQRHGVSPSRSGLRPRPAAAAVVAAVAGAGWGEAAGSSGGGGGGGGAQDLRGSSSSASSSTQPLPPPPPPPPQQRECSICLRVLAPEDAAACAQLPACGHIFHRSCIAHWLSQDSCPLCRAPIIS
jgi:hypothetical protein